MSSKRWPDQLEQKHAFGHAYGSERMKRPPRTKQSAFAMAGGGLFTGVTVVAGALATPVILRALGTERFGAFRAQASSRTASAVRRPSQDAIA